MSSCREKINPYTRNQPVPPNQSKIDQLKRTGGKVKESSVGNPTGHDFSGLRVFNKEENDHGLDRGKTKPKIIGFRQVLRNFNKGNLLSSTLQNDKSFGLSSEDQDQKVNVGNLSPVTNGVTISADVAEGNSSPDYPDGYRWTQTVTTNKRRGAATLLATPIIYVDPTPNDDTKPFYYTDAEEAASGGVFHDTPTRLPLPSGTVNWDAVLSINGVNGNTVTHFDSVGYGFSVDSRGNVTLHPATSPNIGDHVAALQSAFPSWIFQ